MARTRTFIAVELSPAVRGRLVALQERLAESGPAVKWVEPENLHLTLLFLGEVDDRELVQVCRALQQTVAELPVFEIVLTGLGGFPNLRRPRNLWVGVGDGSAEAKALHAALEEPLLDLGCYRRESRPFTPHVTLGRLQGDTGDEPYPWPKRAEEWSAGAMQVREVVVFASELRKEGPSYTVLSRCRLAVSET